MLEIMNAVSGTRKPDNERKTRKSSGYKAMKEIFKDSKNASNVSDMVPNLCQISDEVSLQPRPVLPAQIPNLPKRTNSLFNNQYFMEASCFRNLRV